MRQTLVEREKGCPVEHRRGQQVHVCEAQATPKEATRIDHRHGFGMTRLLRLRQLIQEVKELCALLQRTAGQLPDHERMTEHRVRLERVDKACVAAAQVVDPDGRVDQDHADRRGVERRRGIAGSDGCDPPRATSRRALSLAINALSPACTNAVFSSIRVSRCASASRSSSILRVVFICMSMAKTSIPRKAVRADPDGHHFAYIVLARRGDTTSTPLMADPDFDEVFPALSPDGRWLAHASNKTKKFEVYVRPFPDVNSRRWRVSQVGGTEPAIGT